jgi:hypothetical protein
MMGKNWIARLRTAPRCWDFHVFVRAVARYPAVIDSVIDLVEEFWDGTTDSMVTLLCCCGTSLPCLKHCVSLPVILSAAFGATDDETRMQVLAALASGGLPVLGLMPWLTDVEAKVIVDFVEVCLRMVSWWRRLWRRGVSPH